MKRKRFVFIYLYELLYNNVYNLHISIKNKDTRSLKYMFIVVAYNVTKREVFGAICFYFAPKSPVQSTKYPYFAGNSSHTLKKKKDFRKRTTKNHTRGHFNAIYELYFTRRQLHSLGLKTQTTSKGAKFWHNKLSSFSFKSEKKLHVMGYKH